MFNAITVYVLCCFYSLFNSIKLMLRLHVEDI